MPDDARSLPVENPLHANVRREHGFEALEIEGEIPAALEGTLYRTGPGVFERFGQRVLHAFEADGVVSAVRFRAGAAEGAVKVVRSAGYLEEEKAGRFLYSANARWRDRMRAIKRGAAKTTGNTNMLAHEGRLFALMEGGLPQEIDPETLDTLDACDLEVIPRAFSAHPHRVHSLQTTFNFGLRYGRQMELDLFALPDDGAPRKLSTLAFPWQSMIHDFAMTEKHFVFLLAPVQLVLWRAILGLMDFKKLFQWRPELGARLVTVPLDAPDKPTFHEIDPLWAWHIAGAFEDEGGLSVDLCAYSNFDSINAIGSEVELIEKPHLVRLRTSGARERLVDVPWEFPARAPQTDGRRYRHLYGASEDGIAHIDLDTGVLARAYSPGGLEGSEPVVVPYGDKEDEVYVLNLFFDPAKDRSGIFVFDGKNIAEGPLAIAWFSQPIPETYHGTFVEGSRDMTTAVVGHPL